MLVDQESSWSVTEDLSESAYRFFKIIGFRSLVGTAANALDKLQWSAFGRGQRHLDACTISVHLLDLVSIFKRKSRSYQKESCAEFEHI